MNINRVTNAVTNARRFFQIKDVPGNFFELINKVDNTLDEYNLLIFKENIGKLSGFIGYMEESAIICVNYKRSLGHQNFTLAHEIGHMFLHKGQSISDLDRDLYGNNDIEGEANLFANEILYPTSRFEEDYIFIIENNLLNSNNRKALAEKINELCHIYCVSFELVLRKILFKNRQIQNFTTIKKEIYKSLDGGCISKHFDMQFYKVDESHEWYQINEKPYQLLKKDIIKKYLDKKISRATAESILMKYGMEEL